MLELSRWPYVQSVALSGDMQTDAVNLLTANGKPNTAAHCLSVAHTNAEIAVRFDLDQPAAFTAGLLHDIANIIKRRDMLDYAVHRHWEVFAAEKAHPFLLHQRLSAEIAEAVFHVQDRAVLSAIACHTTLKPNPSDADMALFLADKLSWDQEGTPPFYSVVSSALETSLCLASLTYLNYVLDHNMILSPHPWLTGAKRWLESQG